MPPLHDWSLCFPRFSGRPIVKSCWPSRPDSLGIPSSFVGSLAGKPDVGFRTFTIVQELLWHYCSPGCGSPTQQIWNLILLWLCPSYHLAAASSLSLDMGYLFLVGSSILPSMAVQQLVAVLVLSQEEVSSHPSTLPFWTRTDSYVFFSRYC